MDMNKEFIKLKKSYDDNDFETIFQHKKGNYFLKMRSISRTILLKDFAETLNINIPEIPNKKLFEFMFCKDLNDTLINNFINKKYKSERLKRLESEESLYSQLFKLKIFDWGGFYQNSVEKTIVNNYIKKIKDYEKLCDAIAEDIGPRLKGYILCSWYNNWTSILIEDMFKDHKTILPAVGLIKKVDFFWNNFPFDLKVTYFPEGFMKIKRKEKNLSSEFAELKKFARLNDIAFDKNAKNKEIFSEILTKISEDTSEKTKIFFEKFNNTRKEIIQESINNPSSLIKWLYEEQGERRFDAANRFFLILIDLRNLEDSWKLKRNQKLLKGEISNYLDKNINIDFNTLKLSFNWLDREYTTFAEALFVVVE
jgi:hypothetical protein